MFYLSVHVYAILMDYAVHILNIVRWDDIAKDTNEDSIDESVLYHEIPSKPMMRLHHIQKYYAKWVNSKLNKKNQSTRNLYLEKEIRDMNTGELLHIVKKIFNGIRKGFKSKLINAVDSNENLYKLFNECETKNDYEMFINEHINKNSKIISKKIMTSTVNMLLLRQHEYNVESNFDMIQILTDIPYNYVENEFKTNNINGIVYKSLDSKQKTLLFGGKKGELYLMKKDALKPARWIARLQLKSVWKRCIYTEII